jgi:hypothetical protein
MLSDTDAACVAIALALCLKSVRNCRWIKKWFQRTKNLMTDLMMCGPNDFFAGDSTVI